MAKPEIAHKNKVFFPKNTDEIIEAILKKYNLAMTTEELLESKLTDEEFEKEWRNDFGPRIAQILNEYTQGKIKDEITLVKAIESRLGISKEVAQNLAKDLQKKIINFLQTVSEEVEIPKTTEEEIDEGPPSSKKPDVYREPVE